MTTVQALVAQGKSADASDRITSTYFDAVEPAEETMMHELPDALASMERVVNALRAAIPTKKDVSAEAQAVVSEANRIAALAPAEADQLEPLLVRPRLAVEALDDPAEPHAASTRKRVRRSQ